MHLLAGPFAAFAILLAIAGVAKAARPLPTVRAMRSLSLPSRLSSAALVRCLGVGEALLAVTALVVAGPVPAALVALSYAAFAAFVTYARARGGSVSSCGCFGKPDTPPTAAHIVVNVLAAVIALGAAAWPARSPLGELARSPGAGVPLAALILVTAVLAYLALAEWPRLVAVIREGARV